MTETTLKLEIQKTTEKLKNLREHQNQVREKIDTLEKELKNLAKAANSQLQHIALLGQNQDLFRGQNPVLNESQLQKERDYFALKVKLFESFYPQEVSSLEQMIPETLKRLEASKKS